MCMFVKNPELLTAEKPIKVWKILLKLSEDTYYTPIQLVEVKVGDTLYASKPDKPVINCYKTLFRKIITKRIDEQGVHAYQKKEYAKSVSLNRWRVVTEWEIPKGCKYWLEEIQGNEKVYSEEIAATEMKFIKICE